MKTVTESLSVDTFGLKEYAGRISNVNKRIVNLDFRLKGLYSKVGLRNLQNLASADTLTHYSEELNQCCMYLTNTANDFENIEKLLSEKDPTEPLSYTVSDLIYYTNSIIGTIADSTMRIRRILNRFGFGTAEAAVLLAMGDIFSKYWSEGLSREETFKVSTGSPLIDSFNYGFLSSISPKYGEYVDKKALHETKQTQIKDESILVNPDEGWYKRQGTIFESTAGVTVGSNLYEFRSSGKGEHTEYSMNAEILSTDVYATASGGFYVYTKDKDGKTKRIFSPGVSAEVGVSAAVLQFEMDGRAGWGENNNMLGVYGNVEGKVLSSKAEGAFKLNKDEVYFGGAAELNLLEVSGAGGVSVLGTDIGVTGSFKVGVGAKADIGYTDGKFKFDAGVALGVGFDVGFEVDVSGTVDAICDVASSAVDTVTNTIDSVIDLWGRIF